MAIIALLLHLAPSITFPLVEREFLKDVSAISCSPLASGVALESLLSFYGSLVEADIQIASHVIPNLVAVADKAPKSEVSYSNVAKCVAEVVKNQQGIAAGTISEFTRHLRVRLEFYFFYNFFCGSLTLLIAVKVQDFKCGPWPPSSGGTG